MIATQPTAAVVALKAFFKIADRWRLNRGDRATLLGSSERSVSRWRSEAGVPDLSRDQMERLSYILGIYGGLETIFGDTELATQWVQRPNRDFGGRTPLDRMRAGNVGDLAFVRGYVDRWAAGC